MASFEIQNFRPGLDTRRFELTSVPGTLETLVNAHINQGGEIENRKTIAPISSAQFASTFGAQDTATGIYVFGTATVGVLPTGFNYLKLTHPAVIAGTGYDPSKHAMTGVVTSCLFGAYPFVVATFTDGTTWAYYAKLVAGVVTSVLVSDFTAGIILAYLAGSNTGIATNIKNLLTSTTDYALSTVTGVNVDAFGPVGTQYTVNTVDTSALGTLTAQIKNQGLASLPGTQAFGQFQIVAGAAGTNNFISNVKIVGAAGQAGINLLNGGTAVNWVTTTADTAIAVANSISQYAPTTGFYAIASMNTVLIYAVTIGTSTNNLPITVTVNQNVTANNFNICIGNCAITFSGSGGSMACSSITVAGGSNILSSTVTGSVLGTLVSDIAKNINAHAVGYVACATGATLNLSKITTSSADASAVVALTTTGGVTTGAGSTGSAVISLSTYNSSVTAVAHYTSSYFRGILTYSFSYTSGSLQPPGVSVILGGVTNAPYTYLWHTITSSPGIKITTASKTTYQAVFDVSGISIPSTVGTGQLGNLTYTAVFNCTVTDASGVAVDTDNVTVKVTVQEVSP
jgi:hypothetical protein